MLSSADWNFHETVDKESTTSIWSGVKKVIKLSRRGECKHRTKQSWVEMSGQFGGDRTLDVCDVIEISIWRSDRGLCQQWADWSYWLPWNPSLSCCAVTHGNRLVIIYWISPFPAITRLMCPDRAAQLVHYSLLVCASCLVCLNSVLATVRVKPKHIRQSFQAPLVNDFKTLMSGNLMFSAFLPCTCQCFFLRRWTDLPGKCVLMSPATPTFERPLLISSLFRQNCDYYIHNVQRVWSLFHR